MHIIQRGQAFVMSGDDCPCVTTFCMMEYAKCGNVKYVLSTFCSLSMQVTRSKQCNFYCRKKTVQLSFFLRLKFDCYELVTDDGLLLW